MTLTEYRRVTQTLRMRITKANTAMQQAVTDEEWLVAATLKATHLEALQRHLTETPRHEF